MAILMRDPTSVGIAVNDWYGPATFGLASEKASMSEIRLTGGLELTGSTRHALRDVSVAPLRALIFRAIELSFATLLAACAVQVPKVVAPAERAQSASSRPLPAASSGMSEMSKRRVIVFVWDGLRPDSVDPELTPELARLRDQSGVDFRNHHALYPTLTMVNAAALATGAASGVHGFYGNTEYQPGPSGQNAKGSVVDYTQPFFSEDHAILQTLDAFYRSGNSALLHVDTLFEVAHAAHLSTAAIGKAGPVFLQDYRQEGENGVILDENVVLPRSFGLALQAMGLALPKNTVHQRYPDGALALAPDNGDPSAATEPALITLADGVTPDPRAAVPSAHDARNAYLMRVFLEYVLPTLDPALSMIWLRNPDSAEHSYGPGSAPVLDALRHQDQLLGSLLATLERLGRRTSTDLLIVSDHGHSSVESDPKRFPRRALTGEADGHGAIGAIETQGYAVSGDVRSADWLRRAGFAHVYDGVDCVFDPVMGGIDARGEPLYAPKAGAGAGCRKRLAKVSTPNFEVPAGRAFADAIVIAANGGSEYFYLPQHDARLVRRLVTALQERKPYGPLFVRSVYGAIPGTLPLARVGLEGQGSAAPPLPDLIASFDWDESAVTAVAPGVPGTVRASAQGYRGMHGSFSPIDVRNTLIAVGPDFRAGFRDEFPSSSIDVAPTIASILGLALPHAEGRVLEEALLGGDDRYEVEPLVEAAGPVSLRRVCEVDDPQCKHARRGYAYAFELHGQTLVDLESARRFEYFDKAIASRVRAASARDPRTNGP